MTLTRNPIFLLFCAALTAVAFVLPQPALADYLGQKNSFNVDKSYDVAGRSSVNATLQAMTDKLYFYTDDDWWASLNSQEQGDYRAAFIGLGQEFSNTIYPRLTQVFGGEPGVGIDGNTHITILIHPMVNDAGGYVNTGDNYSKLQAPLSNERKMIYLAARFTPTPYEKIYLAHEFMHLIEFNQKDKLRQITEEVWLNEARADYTSTFLGYDDVYKGSNLEQRVNKFLAQPSASLTEWNDSEAAYGAAHLFTAYLVDHYGIKILADSLQSSSIGIPSINAALKRNGYSQDFASIFNDWVITLFVNDCSYGPNYCYTNPNLKNVRVSPRINYLPASSDVTLAVNYHSTYYAGNWQKIIGGKGSLTLDFTGPKLAKTSVPYLVCDQQGKCQINKLTLDDSQQGSITLTDFGQSVESVVLMPFIGGKTIGFDGAVDDLTYSFSVDLHPAPASDGSSSSNAVAAVDMQALLQMIQSIQAQIASLKTQLAAALILESSQAPKYSCSAITSNLYYGVEQAAQVRCLQEVLRDQGTAIYPEAQVTGSFSLATQAAVLRFQQKYASEILTPAGLKKGTGYVGASTRAKINQLLAQ